MSRSFLLRLAVAAALAMAIAAVIANRPAAAASLRPAITVDADVVTLGDLFDGAGALAGRPVFRSPDPGVTGALPAEAALRAARAAGLAPEPSPVATVQVVRRAVTVDAATLADLVAAAVAGRLQADPSEIEVRLDEAPAPLAADAGAAVPASLESLVLVEAAGRFRAVVAVDVGETTRRLDVAGAAVRVAEVPVLARPLGRGETIGAADAVMERVDIRRIEAGAIRDLADLVGLAARRPLRAGEPVAAGAVEPPRLVRRGDLVTLVYEAPGLALTARGRALSDAAAGETVTVLNEQSRRTVEGVAVGPSKVRIGPRPLRTAAAGGPLPITE